MSAVQNSDEFIAALHRERNAVQTFVDVLKKEEEALIHGRIDDLEMIAADKNRLAEKLEHMAAFRNQYLSHKNYSQDRAGMQLWLSKEGGTDLQLIWDELITLAKIAKQINQTNGKIIATQLQYNQRTYVALQGAAGNISLYGPKGQAFI